MNVAAKAAVKVAAKAAAKVAMTVAATATREVDIKETKRGLKRDMEGNIDASKWLAIIQRYKGKGLFSPIYSLADSVTVVLALCK